MYAQVCSRSSVIWPLVNVQPVALCGRKHVSPVLKLMHMLSGDAARADFTLDVLGLVRRGWTSALSCLRCGRVMARTHATSLLVNQLIVIDGHDSWPDGQHANIGPVDCTGEAGHGDVGRIGLISVEAWWWYARPIV